MAGAAAGLKALRDTLKAGGLERVVIDLSDVNPPAYWLTLGSIDVVTLAGDKQATVHILAVSGYPDETRAYEELDGMHDELLELLEPSEPTTVVGLRTTSSQVPLPAFRITTIIDI